MEPITHLITRYKEGDPNAEKELIAQMSPLIKKYAGKIHFMEYTDAMQELYLALLESLDYLKEHYGITYDPEKYIVDYEIIGSNLMPDVKVFARK